MREKEIERSYNGIHLHSNQPSDMDDRTQRRKIEDHVHGQWVKEEKEKEEKNRNRRLDFSPATPNTRN